MTHAPVWLGPGRQRTCAARVYRWCMGVHKRAGRGAPAAGGIHDACGLCGAAIGGVTAVLALAVGT